MANESDCRESFATKAGAGRVHAVGQYSMQAPAERIWELLVDASSLARWTGTRLLEIFDVLEVVPRQTFRVDVTLPLGVVNHEVIQLAPLDGTHTRVTFN